MKIKPQYLLRSLLVLPYLVWCISAFLVYLVSPSEGDTFTINSLFDWLIGVLSFYMVGIVFWGIPYTILAIGLSLWSLKKPATTFFKVLLFSPFLLGILMGIEVALMSLFPLQPLSLDSVMNILSSALFVIIPALLVGYGFVGLGTLIYKAMEHLSFIGMEGATK